ncbi:hypothetical protein BR93DRAFT_776005 [Coniochaeta sp. PMI_546]|nr:hypothetical protein BR93DRAFT_776005 [Coniochaeta sp. PMI_546]
MEVVQLVVWSMMVHCLATIQGKTSLGSTLPTLVEAEAALCPTLKSIASPVPMPSQLTSQLRWYGVSPMEVFAADTRPIIHCASVTCSGRRAFPTTDNTNVHDKRGLPSHRFRYNPTEVIVKKSFATGVQSPPLIVFHNLRIPSPCAE